MRPMKSADGLALRHELKYIIRTGDHAGLAVRLACVLKRDPNAGPQGEYHIRSLYFDDLWNSALYDKNAGLLHRAKYRIRLYNCSDRTIRFEKKSKLGAWIGKESVELTRKACEEILHGNWSSLSGWPDGQDGSTLAHEIAAVAGSRLLAPKVIVDYVREAYVGPGDLRITFDKALAMAEPTADLFRPCLPTRRIQAADEMILEVKYNAWMPSLVSGILDFERGSQMSASKYVLCRSRQLNIC